MATHDNILVFNQMTAEIFSLLYKNFPVPVTLKESNISQFMIPQEMLFYKSTVQWLSDTGYIKYQRPDTTGGWFYGCVLTAKGLEALNAMPEGLMPNQTLGDAIGECVKTGAKEVAVDMVKKVFSFGVSLVTG